MFRLIVKTQANSELFNNGIVHSVMYKGSKKKCLEIGNLSGLEFVIKDKKNNIVYKSI